MDGCIPTVDLLPTSDAQPVMVRCRIASRTSGNSEIVSRLYLQTSRYVSLDKSLVRKVVCVWSLNLYQKNPLTNNLGWGSNLRNPPCESTGNIQVQYRCKMVPRISFPISSCTRAWTQLGGFAAMVGSTAPTSQMYSVAIPTM
jgi:hypothetical protein